MDPNVSVTLPPEILGKILEHIPTDEAEGRRTLTACALVATRWIGPSQQRLFSSVSINGEDSYHRWMDSVVLSGPKTHLLGYVRSLAYHRHGLETGIKNRTRDLAQDSGGYLSALRNLRSLSLDNFRVEHISEEEFRICFSTFRETLTTLLLQSPDTSLSAFLTLIDYFPNVTTLTLSSLVMEPDQGPVPLLSRPLRGKIHIHEYTTDYLEFFDRFAKLDLEYEQMIISTYFRLLDTKILESVLRISTSTVKGLRLVGELHPDAAVTIDKFQQLRELELVVIWPSSAHEVLLSSITSNELRKVIFSMGSAIGPRSFAQRMEEWNLVIDKQFCGLVDRLRATGYSHTLEVVLRLMEFADPGGYDFVEFLPKFREKGVVVIIDDIHGDRVVYSSEYS